jgi:hypothetical protein
MILTSTTERVAFTPSWLVGQPAAPIFYLRTGSVIERGQMEAELAGEHRAGRVHFYEVAEVCRSGVEHLLQDDPELGPALELINAEAQGEAAGLPEAEKQKLATVKGILAEHWPPYRELMAQASRRAEIAPIVAFRRFCTGIDADGVDFVLGRDGLVSEATMAALDPMWLTAAGARAFGLQYGAAGQEKNSEQPSSSDDNQPLSPADGSSKAAGSSETTDGAKTPGSRSPRGRRK